MVTLLCLTFFRRPVRFALGLAALVVAGSVYRGEEGPRPLRRAQLLRRLAGHPAAERRVPHAAHGTTLHGRQARAPARRRELADLLPPESGHSGRSSVALRRQAPTRGGGRGPRGRIDRVLRRARPAVDVRRDRPTVLRIATDWRSSRCCVLRGRGLRHPGRRSPHDRRARRRVRPHRPRRLQLRTRRRSTSSRSTRSSSTAGSPRRRDCRRIVDPPPGARPHRRRHRAAAGLVARTRSDAHVDAEERLAGKVQSQSVVLRPARKDLGALHDDTRWGAARPRRTSALDRQLRQPPDRLPLGATPLSGVRL